MAENEQRRTPAYVSLTTFLSAIQTLREHGLPPRIDRSVWGSRSGADQSQIICALRFLGLIDDSGATQEALKRLVASEPGSAEEKAVLAEVLKASYPEIFRVGLESVTPLQLEQAIGEYGPKGSTKARAVRFFVRAAEYAGIPMSPRLIRGKRVRTGRRNGASRTRRTTKDQHESKTHKQLPAGEAQAIRTIRLPGAGGSLTVSGTFNPFSLAGDERALVFSIIDKMDEFERRVQSKTQDTD